MGLFSKKYCDICGEKIGLFGNRKLEDGNMCKDCARKLSPWFDDRRHTTLEDINKQLAYREENRKALARFRPTREIGSDMKVYIDERAGTFLVTKAEPKEWEEDNPDVFRLEDVRNARVDVDENRRELYYEDRDGNSVSYSPRRYEYSYTFKMIIPVNHPFVDEIDYDLNFWPLKIEYSDRSLFGLGTMDPTRDSEYRAYMTTAHDIIEALTREPRQEERTVSAHSDGQESVRVVTCPYCGAKSRVTYTGRCENCGGNLEI